MSVLWIVVFCERSDFVGFVMLFGCLKFAVRDRNSNPAMAKSSFKLDHPLGMLFVFFLPKPMIRRLFLDFSLFTLYR